ncbi:MAG TPA: SGNH/GDSL hydrolase family protein [Candidatus Saccharimonadales bacterium]|nr:SGNH/GDSL hydrolase family protein [Candidatus Saccharimonadales bacterium]
MKRLQRILRAAVGLVTAGLIGLAPAAAFAAPVKGSNTIAGYTGKAYVALGDSVAAGVGLTPLTNPTEEDLLCGRTTQAYPRVLAAQLGMNLRQVACSGAQASDLYTSQDVQGTDLSPQIDAAFANGTPDVITLTVGANDLHWNDIVHLCYVAQCDTNASDWAATVGRGYLRTELFWAFVKIDRLSNYHPPKIIVTGYFTPLSTTATCADTQGLTASETQWLISQAAQLNQAIYSVTQWFSFTDFVPISFAGHELCTADPWVQGLSAPQPYHPTAAGQAAIAASIRNSL